MSVGGLSGPKAIDLDDCKLKLKSGKKIFMFVQFNLFIVSQPSFTYFVTKIAASKYFCVI